MNNRPCRGITQVYLFFWKILNGIQCVPYLKGPRFCQKRTVTSGRTFLVLPFKVPAIPVTLRPTHSCCTAHFVASLPQAGHVMAWKSLPLLSPSPLPISRKPKSHRRGGQFGGWSSNLPLESVGGLRERNCHLNGRFSPLRRWSHRGAKSRQTDQALELRRSKIIICHWAGGARDPGML